MRLEAGEPPEAALTLLKDSDSRPVFKESLGAPESVTLRTSPFSRGGHGCGFLAFPQFPSRFAGLGTVKPMVSRFFDQGTNA